LSGTSGASNENVRDDTTRIISQIQRADYQGDQATLKKLYDALTPFAEDAQLASRVRYWRGFDMWRRAVNGFNDSVDASELEQDLKGAVEEFREAITKDPGFVDAEIGLISCLGYMAFMNRQHQARAEELV